MWTVGWASIQCGHEDPSFPVWQVLGSPGTSYREVRPRNTSGGVRYQLSLEQNLLFQLQHQFQVAFNGCRRS